MTDEELVAKKIAFIETCVQELRTLAKPKLLATDVREERFVEHTLQIAIQAALDVASHIVSDGRLGEPATNVELFEILAARWRLPEELARAMRSMVGFRNILVHGYAAVDPAILRDILENRLGDLLAYVKAIMAGMRP